MDLCVYTWFGYRYPFEDIIKLIKDAGFQAVMTWWGDEFIESNGPKEAQPDIVRKAGLKLENIHLSFTGINYIWEDSINGTEIFDKYVSYIDDCKKYEIPAAVMHLTSGENPPSYNQTGLNRIKRLIERAEKNNVNIAIENVRHPEYLDYVFENIQSDKLKFCYDSGHENCFTKGIKYLEKYGDKLGAMHLHDNNGIKDEHLLPFEGNINWERIMKQILQTGYGGSLAFEIDSQYIDVSKKYTAEGYLAEAVKRGKELMELMR
ncbi:MAG: sugar phosphate isomerase/epimerase [Spirochaetaceae bacterium]|jgi:sugar phosphate isomerase/epimerase|nr:sugar phosphate isomerase/epimerase [Spirochaetaceae bacterium]